MPDLFDWRDTETKGEQIEPWKPVPLTHEQWPPDYRAVYAWRIKTLRNLRSNPHLVPGMKAYYAKRPGEFIMHWCDTYNPRKSANKWMPFVFFMKQADVIDFFQDLSEQQESGLIEKCRDAGATWLACGYSIHRFLFIQHDSVGWGSRKANLVDKLGDADSIFEKMRLIMRRLPREFIPNGWNEKKHATYMRFVNPENGSAITGEAGDNIGRGGRKAIYFKDEAQPLHSKVVTPFGWCEIGSLSVGDLVCGPDGDWRSVIGINDCGEHETFRFTFSDGTQVESSYNHLWNIEKFHGKRETKTLRSHEIFKSFRYESPSGQIQYRYRLPQLKPVEYFSDGRHDLHPYVAGVLLGDGSINSGCISFTSVDSEIVLNVAANAPEGCKVTFAGKCAWRIVDVRGRQGNKPEARSRAREAVKNSGIYGHLAHKKFVPDEYKYSTIGNRLSILQGLMDTDGSASGGQITFHSCSERLADDVREIVQSLGGIASKVIKPDYRGYRDIFVINFTLPDGMIPFKLTRKIAAMKPRKHRIQKTIINVEKIGIQTVRCISVDSDNGLYLTDGFAVTHNSAHYERPELIEAALGDNTNVQIDISSVNGLGNAFHKRRMAGVEWSRGKYIETGYTRVMVIDWRDHPEKNQEWYDRRRAKHEREGLLHIFAQEVDRDYAAAVSNVIIPKVWLLACLDAHEKLGWDLSQHQNAMAGLDVADGGIDRNGFVVRTGLIMRHAEEWGERDPGVTTRRAAVTLRRFGRCRTMYDSIGVGASVKSEYNRLVEDNLLDATKFPFVAWNAGSSVINPEYRVIEDDEDSIKNDDMFYNIKAQAWWSMRTRVYKTWRMIEALKPGGEPARYPVDELISFDSKMPLVYQVIDELAQPVKKDSSNLKMLVDKQPDGMKSPNLGDGTVMCYFPIEDSNMPLVGHSGVGAK